MNKNRKRKFFLGALAAAAAVLILWTVWDNMTVGMTHVTVASSRLPASFDHFKIVVVSDLHNAEFGTENDSIVRLVEEEAPDLIALTGDLVDSSRTNLDIAAKLTQKLATIAPCCYVTGNHEAWIGKQYQELEKRLLDAGVVILHDQSVPLTKKGETIQLAGLDDPDFTDGDSSSDQNMWKSRIEQMHLTDDYCILLSHRPEAFEAYAASKIDLVLSGHAHGGQFRLPFLGGIVAPNQGFFPKYDAGMYTENDTTMVVSRGIGNSIIPVRFYNQPELVCVELVCEK